MTELRLRTVMASLYDDTRGAVRRLLASPAFSVISIGTLALAIGANAAMFSFVKGVLLSPLPYPEADRIVRVLERSPAGSTNAISTLNYLDLSRQQEVFQFVAAEAGWQASISGGDAPLALRGARVSPSYFEIFGVTAAHGRTFLPGEDEPGRDRVVLLSHALWQSRFGGDLAILQQHIVVNGEPHVVAGILPAGGPFDRAAARIWKPLALEASQHSRDYRWLGASAKLSAGVPIERARAVLDVIARRLADAHPESNAGWGVAVDRLSDVVISPGLRTAVTTLFAATVFVVLIACVNLTHLALARSVSRRGEMAVRAALGATRWRLTRAVLLEQLVLSAAGGAAGLLAGYAVLQWIRSLIPPHSLPPAVSVTMDAEVMAFTLLIAGIAGLAVGWMAVSRGARPDVADALKEHRDGPMASRRTRHAGRLLVITEVALAFVLLAGSGLLMRSFARLLDVDPGFTARNVLAAGLPIEPAQYPDPGALNHYLATLCEAVEAVPGIGSAALTSALPLEGIGFGARYAIAGRDAGDRARRRVAFFKIVSASYFDTVGIALRQGRPLNPRDRAGAPPVVLINEAFARREFSNEDPTGHRILVRELVAGRPELGGEISWEIVGVVADEKVTGLGDDVTAGMYVSHEQSPTYGLSLVVKTDGPPERMQQAIRAAVEGVSRDQALADVRSLESIVAQSMLGNRIVTTVLLAFAGIAVALAAVGLYGVISYTTRQRTREMGIRAALGASAGSLRKLIWIDGLLLVCIGLAAGLVGTHLMTDVLSSMLYGVGPRDPLTLGAAAALLVGVAGLACVAPARRVTSVSPATVLRR